MATGISEDLKTFMETINAAVDFLMEVEISEMVKDAIYTMVEIKVYREYEPKDYQRWGEYGGLQDRHNMEVHYDKRTKTLTVQNVRDDQDTKEWRWKKSANPDITVADVVENGGPYSWRGGEVHARPFHKPAEDFLINGGYVDRKLTEELESNLAGFSL